MSETSVKKSTKATKRVSKARAKRNDQKDSKEGWRKVLVWIIPTVIGFILAVVGFVYSTYQWLATLGITLAVIGLLGFFLFLAEWYVWTKSKTRKKARTIFVVLAITLFGAGLYWTYGAWNESDKVLRGFLVPDGDPSPQSSCSSIPDSAVVLYYGDSTAWIGTTNPPFNVIVFAGEPILNFERATSGAILVNATIRDEKGREVATIRENVFRARKGSGYDATSQDPHTLLVLNDKDDMVLSVRYLNPKAIKILGTFHEPNRPPLIISENGISMPSGAQLGHICFGDIGHAQGIVIQ